MVDEDAEIFAPSPFEHDLSSYDFSEEEATVLAVHAILKRAALPLPTCILAALIIRKLPRRFYSQWCDIMYQNQTEYDERTRELVVVAALVSTSYT